MDCSATSIFSCSHTCQTCFRLRRWSFELLHTRSRLSLPISWHVTILSQLWSLDSQQRQGDNYCLQSSLKTKEPLLTPVLSRLPCTNTGNAAKQKEHGQVKIASENPDRPTRKRSLVSQLYDCRLNHICRNLHKKKRTTPAESCGLCSKHHLTRINRFK